VCSGVTWPCTVLPVNVRQWSVSIRWPRDPACPVPESAGVRWGKRGPSYAGVRTGPVLASPLTWAARDPGRAFRIQAEESRMPLSPTTSTTITLSAPARRPRAALR
jgi:hypothetical protein